MIATENTPDAVARVAHLAEDFCRVIDGHAAGTPAGFLGAVHARLPALYAAVLALPAVEVDDADEDEEANEAAGEPTDADGAEGAATSPPSGGTRSADRSDYDEWRALYRALAEKIGAREYYAEVFDPYAEPPEEPVTGSLADDLADIYRDLQAGLARWRRGESAGAVWAWRFQFTVHWGEHATGALRALHALASTHELGFPTATS